MSNMPERSKLYSIEPCGLRTPHVESATGYIERLAHEHNLLTTTLLRQMLFPLVARQLGITAWDKLSERQYCRHINGAGVTAEAGIHVLHSLTGRSDLRALTMLAWSPALSDRIPLRETEAWCPECYQEWRLRDSPIYIPLLWHISIVTVCVTHRRYLSSRCHHADCRRALPILAPRSRPGFCSRCFRWLGHDEPEKSPSEEVLAEQQRIVTAVGELLAAAPDIEHEPHAQRVSDAIVAITRALTSGNMSALADMVGVSTITMHVWIHGRHVPTLPSLLHLCSELGLSPLAFLTEPIPELVDQAVAQHAKCERKPSRWQAVEYSFDRVVTEKYLHDVVASDAEPPLSLNQVAQTLGYSRTSIRRHFLELTDQIVERYRSHVQDRKNDNIQALCDEVRRVIPELDRRGIHPTKPNVRRHMSKTNSFWYEEVNTAWLEEVEALNRKPVSRD